MGLVGRRCLLVEVGLGQGWDLDMFGDGPGWVLEGEVDR